MNKKPKVTEVNILFFVFEILFLLFQIVLVVIALLFSMKYGSEYYESFFTDNMYMITLISELGIILLPVLIFTYIKKLNFKSVFRLNKPGILPMLLIIPAAFGAYLVAMMLNGLVIFLIQQFGEIPRTPVPVPRNLTELIVGILVIAVTPAICEELMHRGLFLSAYERRGTVKALVITSIFFGIFHFDVTNLLGPIFLGLLIGYFVIRTNSIWAGIFAHFLNNTIAELHQYFFSDPSVTYENAAIGGEEIFFLVLAGIGGLIFLSVVIAGFHASTSAKAKYIPAIANTGQDIKSVMTHWPIVVVLVLYVIIAGMYIFSVIYAV